MGNCCGKPDGDENFQGEGRTLGATPSNAPPRTDGARAAVPPKAKIGAPQAGHTLGKTAQTPEQSASPKEAAARAAEERAKASTQGKGKLGKQLDAQKSQTQTITLAQTARDNAAARDADAAAQTRNWN